MRGILCCLILVMSFAARADLGLSGKLDIELKIQQKLSQFLDPIYPESQIAVNVELRKISATLPGTDLTVTNSFFATQTGALSFDDIEKVDVFIRTKNAELKPEVQALIQTAIGMPKGKLNLRFGLIQASEIPPAPAGFPASTSRDRSLEAMANSISQTSYDLRILLYLMAGSVCLFILITTFFESNRKKQIESAVGRMAQALSAGSQSSMSEARRPILDVAPTHSSATHHSAQLPAGDKEFIQSLSIETVNALLSDCYWCEVDAYALWLWNRLSNPQRQGCLTSWVSLESYVKSLSSHQEERLNYHNHPYYLHPSAHEEISQGELKAWALGNKGAWHHISPLRQAHLDLPLVEKIQMSLQKSAGVAPPLPKTNLSHRNLQQSLEVGTMTEQDELNILKDPHSIPAGIRHQIPTLAWVGLITKEEREELMQSMSAIEIAEAMAGPAEIVEMIISSLGEKKQQIVRDYLKLKAPSKKSMAYRFLISTAVDRLAKGDKSVSAAS